ncbi:MAG: DUF1667 domain-containing protein [Ruthenibacterium sp.]
MTELICIVCPKGCHLHVDEQNGYTVTGNACARGAEYGHVELTAPTRVITSTVAVTGGAHPRCSVKTDKPIPKHLIFDAMQTLDGLVLTAPVALGQVVVKNVCGTDASFVTTRSEE